MWKGAVFMPLIEDTETIDPGLPCSRISRATAWLMKNAVSRFLVNNSRQSSRVTRVEGIHVDGSAPPATLTSPYSVPSVRRTRSMTVAIPSSVDASAATGTTDKPRCASGVTCSSRFSFDRLTATTVAPASAASRVTVVPMPPPPAPDTTTMRPSSLKRSSMVTLFVRTTYGALHIAEHYSAAALARQGRISSLVRLLSGLNQLDSVRGHDLGRAAGPLPRREPHHRRRVAARTAHRAQPAVRCQRSAHRSRRTHLCRAGDRQPDQRTRSDDGAAGYREREGQRHHRARRCRVRSERQYVRDRGDGRSSQRARTRRRHPRAARRPPVRQRNHRVPRSAVHK